MNKEESLALYASGSFAWNQWAEERLAEREAMKTEGTWIDSKIQQVWRERAKADFESITFEAGHHFTGFIFPGEALFDQATFRESSDFVKTKFLGFAGFHQTTFNGYANFRGASFFHAGFDYATFRYSVEFSQATFRQARFTFVNFHGNANFTGSAFSEQAVFSAATFHAGAMFESATFSQEADFERATFSNYAWFIRVKFNKFTRFNSAFFGDNCSFSQVSFERCSFIKTRFSGTTHFNLSTFAGKADFSRSRFMDSCDFGNAKFERDADFRAITATSSFSLAGTVFSIVPDLIQATFQEAPRLDNIRIEPESFFRSGRTANPAETHEMPTAGFRARLRSMSRLPSRHLRGLKSRFAGDPDLAARWRALKRLALDGHDHQQELAFFKGELKALRWSAHMPWHGPFLFGLFYQLLSDFGRSIMRPLLWWLVALAGFGWAYLDQHRAMARQPMRGLAWVGEPVRSLTGSAASPDACIVGMGEPWIEALGLSLRKGLLFLGVGVRDRLDQVYACLYGIHTTEAVTPGELPATFRPVIPVTVDMLGFLQMLVSVVLIFLFLLAIRNHFRIK